MENRFSKRKSVLGLKKAKFQRAMARRFISLLILCLMATSMVTSFIRPAMSNSSNEPLCKFEGPDEHWYIELTDYIVYGPSNPRVGDDLIVFFTLRYIGKSGQAVLDRVYVKAVLPDGSIREYEDRSYRGRTLNPGESVRFHTEIEVSMKGVWRLQPSFEYHISGNAYSSPEHWHECVITVSSRESTTTTTPTPLPDLSFNPQYTQPLGYSRCEGFYAHIKNTGTADLTRNTTALFRIRYGDTIVEDRRVTIPALRAGEETTIYSGPFVGVPGREYKVTVILDADNLVSEISESNIRSLTMMYHDYDLPVLDLEVKSLEYTGSSINFTVKHSGCIDSPQTTAHLGVKTYPTGEIVELDSITVSSLSGLDEVQLSFNDLSDYIASNPELSSLTEFEIHVWVDAVEVTYNVIGQEIVIEESNNLNNERILHISTALIIEGPNTYFLKRRTGYTDYVILYPQDIWRAVGGVPGKNITYEYEVDGCNAQITSSSPTELIITLPGPCHERGMTLRVKAESGGIIAEKDVELLFYDVKEPRIRDYHLYSSCLSNDELNASNGFLFAGHPIEIWFSPEKLLLPVTYTHASGQRITYEEPRLQIIVNWQVNGLNRTYTVPSENISIDWSNHYIVFTIPNDEVFDEITSKAIQVNIKLSITTGSDQRITYYFDNYWLHEEPVFQVYMRSYNFLNSPCPSISWSMWETFWGVTAVNDCITRDLCFWKDPASYLVYEYAFKEMCDVGRCFSYALTSQKFYEDDVYACRYCEGSMPQPFALWEGEIVCTNDICEAAGEPHCPRSMALTTYLTYEYMWALDERNVFRGVDKFDRYRAGEDIVLETLNELWEWENLPPDEKWSNPYIIMMIPPVFDEITNAHAVLAYRVEKIDENHFRVWVVDSNRPFQPNNATNQERSYIDFYCCGDDGRWNYTFTFDDGRVLSDFLYATPTDLFEGESSAITTLDVLRGAAKHFKLFLELLSHLGAAPESSDNEIKDPSLYMIYSGADIGYIQVEDDMGRRIFDPSTGRFEEDPNKISVKITPLLLPAPIYVFVGEGTEPVKISLQTQEGDTIILSEDTERSVKLEYSGGGNQLNEFSISPWMLEVSGTSTKGFMITSHSINGKYPYEIIVSTRPGRSSLKTVFEDDGTLKITNLGKEELVFDLRLSRYNFDKREIIGETYDGLKAEPNATLTIAPESWENVVGGKITIRVDKGSDGVIDYEETMEPRSIRPVAVAHDVYVYANETGYAKVVLDGSDSYSPLNKPLTWTWRGDFLEGREVKGEKVTVTMTTGTWIVELVVSDGELESIPKEITVHVLPENMKPDNETITSTQTITQAPSTHTTMKDTESPTETQSFLERILQLIKEKNMLLILGALIVLVLIIAAYVLHKR